MLRISDTKRDRIGPLRLLAILAAAAMVLSACNGDDADVTDEPDDADPDVDEPDEDPEDDPDAEDDPADDPDEAEEADDEEAAEDRPDFLTLATGSTGGTYFPLGGAVAGVWNDHIDDLQTSTQSSGASVENLRLLEAEEVELIWSVNGVAADAMAGEGEFEEPVELSFLGNIYPEVAQIVAHADSGIETIADMEGQRVAVGPPGSGTEVLARQLLGEAGLDIDSDIEVFSEAFGDAADGIRDGQIDAAFAVLALPAGSIEEIATTTDLNYVSIEEDLVDSILADDPSMSSIDVEAETYPGQDSEITWLTNWATLYARPDLHEDVAYDLVRVQYEEGDAIAEAHAVGDQIQLDTALDGRADIPIHPGAERYYDEVGAEENGEDGEDEEDGEDDE